MQLFCFQADFILSLRDNEKLVIKTIEVKMLEAKILTSFKNQYDLFDPKE